MEALPLQLFDPWMQIYFVVLIGFLGACLGSFVNCYSWRKVRGESALRGRSFCPSCHHLLGPLELVPLFSWLFLRGKCKHCGAKVSPRYFLVELFMAVLFVLLVLRFGLGVQALIYGLVACVLLAVSLVDLETFTIPNGFVLALIGLWLVSIPFVQPVYAAGIVAPGSLFVGLVGPTWLAVALDGLAGALAFAVLLLVVALIFDALTGKNSLGGGDIKLFFAVGLFLGLPLSFVNVMISCVLGIIGSFIFAARSTAEVAPGAANSAACSATEAEAGAANDVAGAAANGAPAQSSKALSANRTPEAAPHAGAFPFGPAIALSTMVTLLYGSALISWYLDFIF